MPWWVAVEVICAVVVALAVLWVLWWWWPKWEVKRRHLQIRDPKARADVEDNFRKTIGQLIGGAAVLGGAWLAYSGTQQTLQVSHDQLRAAYDQIKEAHDQLISQQVSKGFEQLGSKDNIVVRLGGIYALEGVMNTSEQYHQPVLEALCAFVRDGTKTGKGAEPPATTKTSKGTERPATDIQAALTVIARRAGGPGGVDLTGADLSGAILRRAHLSGGAILSRAILSGADLGGAYLIDADLSHANLFNADLFAADLFEANLTFATLSGANLSRTVVWQSQLDGACGDTLTKLPPGLTIKPCP